jgi:hypothetical protein
MHGRLVQTLGKGTEGVHMKEIKAYFDKEAKAAYVDARISPMTGFIFPVYKCPDCKTKLHFEDDSDTCYCSKCGCKVKAE